MVGEMKRAISSTLERTIPDFETFRTVIAQAEALVNSRPLFSLSHDVNDNMAITPAHLLIGRSLYGLNDELVDLNPPDKKAIQWASRNLLMNELWDRWKKGYLLTLHAASKWNVEHNPPRLGEIVLIKTDSKSRWLWPLGKIIQLYVSPRDQVCRKVRLRTLTGEVDRSLHYLYRLEMADSAPTDQVETPPEESTDVGPPDKESQTDNDNLVPEVEIGPQAVQPDASTPVVYPTARSLRYQLRQRKN
jgi:hypothetical protein